MNINQQSGKLSMSQTDIINYLLGFVATVSLAAFGIAMRWLIRRNADLTNIKKLMAGFVTQEEMNVERAELHRLKTDIETGVKHRIIWTRGGNYAIIPVNEE